MVKSQIWGGSAPAAERRVRQSRIWFIEMLKCLDIENFRCFERHHVPLQPFTVIVGANNAGKSTITEALRLVSVVVSRYEDIGFSSAPPWTGLGPQIRGYVLRAPT